MQLQSSIIVLVGAVLVAYFFVGPRSQPDCSNPTEHKSTPAPASTQQRASMAVAKIPNDIFQFSTTGALHAGFDDSQPIVNHLPGYGSYGLGAVAGTGQELIFADMQAFTVDPKDNKNHVVRPAPGSAGLAFIMVTKFMPEYQTKINGPFKRDALLDIIGSQGAEAGSKNSFIPFRVKGNFATIKILTNNALRRQQTLLPEDNSDENILKNVKGTIFGFIGPQFFEHVAVTGVHCYFLSDAGSSGERKGGSFVDFETTAGAELSWAVTGRYHLGFPRGDEWESLKIESSR